MPTRVIEIVRQSNGCLHRLWETQPGQVEPYAALSYCWGGDQTFKTTRQTLSQYRYGIPSSNLPQTLQDALAATAQLGLRFIWIDALCIIQDDSRDKGREIAQMARVYGNATVTIAASRASTAWEGFFGLRPPLGVARPDLVFQLPSQSAGKTRGSVVLAPLTWERTEPIDLRGWTYQERVLSPRVLDFGTLRTHWSCRTQVDGTASSASSAALADGWSHQTAATPYGAPGLDKNVLADLMRGRFSQAEMRVLWMQIAQGFTHRTLGFQADKLPAIAGMAEIVGRHLHDGYVAGLWRAAFPAALLWENGTRAFSLLEPRPPPDQTAAPSWSWAALAGPVEYDVQYSKQQENLGWDVKVHGCAVQLADGASPYGAVAAGRLALSAPAQRAVWVRHSEYGAANLLLAAGPGLSDDGRALRYAFAEGQSTGLSFVPDALEDEFRDYPPARLDVVLVLFGVRVFPVETGLNPSLFGLALRPLEEPGMFSRLGVFKSTRPPDEFARYTRWFREPGKEDFVIV